MHDILAIRSSKLDLNLPWGRILIVLYPPMVENGQDFLLLKAITSKYHANMDSDGYAKSNRG